MHEVPLGFRGIDVRAGSHVVYTYTDEDQRTHDLFEFITAGIKNGEKCVAAVPEYPWDFWADNLRARGVDFDGAEGRRFEILTPSGLLPAEHTQQVQAVVRRMVAAVKESKRAGAHATRLCTSLGYVLQQARLAPRLLRSEAGANKLVEDEPVVLMCTFSRGQIAAPLLNSLVKAHPLLTDGTNLWENPEYLAADAYIRQLPRILDELSSLGVFAPPTASLDFAGDTPILRLNGELDLCTCPNAEEMSNWLIKLGHKRLIVDLSSTSFLDATAISMFAKIMKALEERAGRLAIHDPTTPLRKIFQISALGKYIPICCTLDEAIRALCQTA